MFTRIMMLSTLAAASLSSARPALAENAAANGREPDASATPIAESRDRAAMEVRPDAPAEPSERKDAPRDEAAGPSYFGLTGVELNAFGGA